MTTNQPIPLETLRKAVQWARELEGKATKGPWRYLPISIIGKVGDFEDAELLPFCRDRWNAYGSCISLSRSLLPAVLEMLERVEEHYRLYDGTDAWKLGLEFQYRGAGDPVITGDNVWPLASALVRWYESEEVPRG